MKIIFLDVDGVLNLDMGDSYSCFLDQDKIFLLNHLIRATGASIVISSRWRDKIIEGKMNIAGFHFMLQTHGFLREAEIEGITVSDRTLPGRGNQIKKWLSENKRTTSYVILDDTEDGFNGMNFIKIDGKKGLTLQDVDEAISILGKINTEEKIVPTRQLYIP